MSDLLAMVPLERDSPLQYPLEVLASVLQRRRLETSGLLEALEKHCKAIKLEFQLYDHLNASNYVAKVNNVTVDYEPAEERDRLWIFSTTLVIFLFQFDDHFDKPSCSPENASMLSTEMKTILRAFRKHAFNGLQGQLEDWPASVPLKEAYLWLLKEAEELREGTAEVLHYAFMALVYGVETEITEWGPDAYSGDMSRWNLQRYDNVRKHTGGMQVATVPIIYIANKRTTKEHYIACEDMVNDYSSLIVGLANDIIGSKKDKMEEKSSGVKSINIASEREVVQHHNDLVKCLKKAVLELQGDTRRFMEEVEVATAGLAVWQLDCKRYLTNKD